MSFKDKVVIVTGSSSGIGAATAIEFTKEGANVVITGRNEAKIKKVFEDCAKYGKEPFVVKADISDEAQSKSIIDKTIEKYGKIDVLVNNAGRCVNGSILNGNLMQAYDGVMNTNLRPVFYLTMLVAPHLIKSKGNIVNISSIAGVTINSPDYIPYCASKAALDHFTRGSALELGSQGVRVNAVNPGPVITDFLENAGSDLKWEEINQMTILERCSDAKEIADMILYLASDKSRGVTGSTFYVDNGMLLKQRAA